MHPSLFLLHLALFIGICSAAGPVGAVETQALHANWEYRQSGTEEWSPAAVPGCVHTDLLRDGRIDDPSYRLNERDQQWVGYADWEYRTVFEVSGRVLERQHVRLVFEGLDTFADVYLNGKLLLTADNMFRTWKVDCKKLLKPGKNQLRVYFHNVFAKTLPRLEQSPFALQAFTNNDQAKVKVNMHVRKAGFHFGWDWGPRLVTCGVWRNVSLQSWDEVLIESTFYEQKLVTAKRADLTAHVEMQETPSGPVEVVIRDGDKELTRRKLTLLEGERIAKVDFSIDKPSLWWTHDLGDQPLYKFTTELRTSRGNSASSVTEVGLRDLKVDRGRDEHGQTMRVVLNGVPLFVKGANYIPQDNFQSRVTEQGYRNVIGSAREANMNMLRVWGGGIYEEDLFYDLCDRTGVLVWQDTMFACAMYPADGAFLANVRAEVVDNASRLRNHPSLALYCGNNEVEISWHEWGWKEQYDDEEQSAYESNLHKLFYDTIPEALKQVDPTRYYHPSSPMTGYAARPYHDGDVHYWGVWHSQEPFEQFEENVGRFMSEYGFQSYPDIRTVSRYTEPDDRHLESDVMHAHQRSMSDEGKDMDYGNRLISQYLEQYFPQPRDFASHLRVTQLVQAYGVQTAIETHRRRKPYCMGTLFWQINDCWPVASWSSIDYYGSWKAAHYSAKQAYSQTILPTVQRGDEVEIYVVSDHLGEDIQARLDLALIDFNGRELWTDSRPVVVTNFEGRLEITLSMADLPNVSADSQFLAIELVAGKKTLAEATHCFVYPRHLRLKNPRIKKSLRPTAEGYSVTLQAEKFASYAHIETVDGEGRFSDNYFDMQPGKSYTVTLTTDQPYDIEEEIVVRSLYDLMELPLEGQALRDTATGNKAVNQ